MHTKVYVSRNISLVYSRYGRDRSPVLFMCVCSWEYNLLHSAEWYNVGIVSWSIVDRLHAKGHPGFL